MDPSIPSATDVITTCLNSANRCAGETSFVAHAACILLRCLLKSNKLCSAFLNTMLLHLSLALFWNGPRSYLRTRSLSSKKSFCSYWWCLLILVHKNVMDETLLQTLGREKTDNRCVEKMCINWVWLLQKIRNCNIFFLLWRLIVKHMAKEWPCSNLLLKRTYSHGVYPRKASLVLNRLYYAFFLCLCLGGCATTIHYVNRSPFLNCLWKALNYSAACSLTTKTPCSYLGVLCVALGFYVTADTILQPWYYSSCNFAGFDSFA